MCAADTSTSWEAPWILAVSTTILMARCSAGPSAPFKAFRSASVSCGSGSGVSLEATETISPSKLSRASKSVHAKMSGGIAPKNSRATRAPTATTASLSFNTIALGAVLFRTSSSTIWEAVQLPLPEGMARIVSVTTRPCSGCLSSMTIPVTGSTPPQNDNPVPLKARRPVAWCVAPATRAVPSTFGWSAAAGCMLSMCPQMRPADVVAFRSVRCCCCQKVSARPCRAALQRWLPPALESALFALCLPRLSSRVAIRAALELPVGSSLLLRLALAALK